MMTKEEIGKIIKTARIDAGLTQIQVASKLNRPQQTIANWEVGRSQPDANTLFELFKILGADLNTSFGFPPVGRETSANTEKSDPETLSDIEQAHIKKYRLLDPYGKEAVDGVLDVEWRRCTQPAQGNQPEPDNIIYITSWFPMPMSAGTGHPAGSDEPEELELTKRPPRGTSYVAPVSGDSMEPTYHNGDKLFIRAGEEIEVGQIGVFLMDGQQWVKELGDGVLISHNSEKYGPIPMRDDIRCQGLVLGVCDESYFDQN